ncbi:MAG: radical SAM protein [Ruminococcaceae bacterium]|nr:radical SAM protein [Oscillospiraceae bacterium]
MEEKLSLFDMLSQAKEANVDESNMAQIMGDIVTRKSNLMRAPLTIQLELLPLCNFRCSFCYVRKTKEEVARSGREIMRFEDWKPYIDFAFESGVDSVTLTGGECTLHPDFKQIYAYAYDKGMELSVITNASLIDDAIIDLFLQKPPSRISVTLYGMSEETYERTCGNGAAFSKVLQNIERMLSCGLKVTLNYTAGNDNFCDMEAVLAYAREHKIAVFPTNALMNIRNCDDDVIQAQYVDSKKYKEIEIKHMALMQNISFETLMHRYLSEYSQPLVHNDRGFTCSAGNSAMFVNWQGLLVPCVNFNTCLADPREVGFEEAWNTVKAWVDKIPNLEECEGCIFYDKCHRCPAIHYGDTGEFGKVSARLCFKKLYPEEAEKALADYEKNLQQTKSENR